MSKDLVFIVSAGRTGTAFLGERIKRFIPGCYSVHEPDVFVLTKPMTTVRRVQRFGFRHMVIDRFTGKSGLRNLSLQRLAGSLGEKEALTAIRKHREGFIDSIPEPLIVESSYQWFALLPDLRKIWPQAKVVCVIRDPGEWIDSWRSYGSLRQHHGRWNLVELLHRPHLSPGYLNQEDQALNWNNLGQIERLAWEWNLVNSTILDFCDRDELSRTFRFEDLFGIDATEHSKSLLEFMTQHQGRSYSWNLPTDSHVSRINASSRSAAGWKDWRPETRDFVVDECGLLMRRFGYE